MINFPEDVHEAVAPSPSQIKQLWTLELKASDFLRRQTWIFFKVVAPQSRSKITATFLPSGDGDSETILSTQEDKPQPEKIEIKTNIGNAFTSQL
jgi:hypothetical protein